jgi:hypothetical protein
MMILGAAVIGLIPQTVETPRPNAVVLASDTDRLFVTPPYLQLHPELVSIYNRPTTYGATRAAGYKAERGCNEAQCWSQDGRSLTGRFLESIGVLRKLPSRWNSDGSWNW